MSKTSGVKRDCVCVKVRHEHGTVNAYQSDRCRCTECREASRVSELRRRRLTAYGRFQGPRPAVGTVRRLRALAALGWNKELLAVEAGLARSHTNRLLLHTGEEARVFARVHNDVAAAYDRLWDKQPPRVTPAERRSATIARTRAAQRGWVTPLAWDEDTIDDPAAQPWTDDGTPVGVDEVAVERIISGALKAQYSPELLEAIRILAGRGWADSEIGHRIGRQPANVCKIRERNAIPSGVPQPGHLRNKETAA